MNNRTQTEQEYYAALQRLLDGKKAVSLNAIAIEAGKKQGSLRAARYPELIKEINQVIEIQSKNLIPSREPKFEEKIQWRDKKLDDLENHYSTALQKIVSLERQVFQLQDELEEFKNSKNNVRNFPKFK